MLNVLCLAGPLLGGGSGQMSNRSKNYASATSGQSTYYLIFKSTVEKVIDGKRAECDVCFSLDFLSRFLQELILKFLWKVLQEFLLRFLQLLFLFLFCGIPRRNSCRNVIFLLLGIDLGNPEGTWWEIPQKMYPSNHFLRPSWFVR